MNILFVYTSQILPEKGGVQRVTKVLGDHFETLDIKVQYLSILKSKSFEKNHFFFPNSKVIDAKENLKYISSIVLNYKIDIIINQSALGGGMSSLCFEAKKKSKVKILSVIHNSLLGSVESFNSSNKKIFNVIPVSFLPFANSILLKKIFLNLYIYKYRNKYNKLYKLSDKIILLSKNYFPQFKLFVKNATKEKVLSIYNPCSFNKDTSDIKKENELLFVGRINITQKRVDILLKIWKELFERFPDWKLNIVGNGPDLEHLINRVNEMNLDRVFFVGHQDPVPYYKTAKILCMTSSYEGLPLVLSEAQNYGVYPILFNSFASANDIIKNNTNGTLIKPFDIKSYIENIENLMLNYEEKSKIFNLELQKNVNRFSINNIGDEWLNLFNKTLNEH